MWVFLNAGEKLDTRFRKDAVSNRCHSDMRHNGTLEIIAMNQDRVNKAVIRTVNSSRNIPAYPPRYAEN